MDGAERHFGNRLRMFEDTGYAPVLRLIGQVLETLRIESFAVRPDGDAFIVRDKTKNRAQLTPRERAFLGRLDSSHGSSRDPQEWHQLASGVVEWRMTPNDLERLELENRQRRRAPGETTDSHSISQMLRAVGGALDQKAGRLVILTKDEQTVTLEYLLPSGQKAVDEFTLSMIYDLWVRMYKKRASRGDAGKPSE